MDAAEVEGLRGYEMIISASGAGAYFAEDFPHGADEHGKTLAVGVLRWCRFEGDQIYGCLHSKLIDLEADRFATAAERDLALETLLQAEVDEEWSGDSEQMEADDAVVGGVTTEDSRAQQAAREAAYSAGTANGVSPGAERTPGEGLVAALSNSLRSSQCGSLCCFSVHQLLSHSILPLGS